MSERGVFAVDRGIWEHDVLVDDQPFSRREAWLWLLSEAAWKPHRRRLAGRSVELDRGQCAASLRFMASKWHWTESRVRRFLDLLKSERMIDAATDAGITVITITKYDRYQRVSLPNDATIASLPDAAPTQERHKVEGTEHKEDFKAAARGNAGANARTAIGLNVTNAPTPSARSSISDEAFDLARQVVDAIGSGAVDHPIEVGAPAHCQKWINEGWNPQFCLIVVRQVMNRRGHDNPPNTLKFFDKAISQYHAEMHRPLPKTNINTQETINVAGSKITARRYNSAGGPRGSSIIAGLRLAHAVLGIDIENDDRIEVDPALR